MTDEQFAKADAGLKALKETLAALKAKQASLEKTVEERTEREASLKNELESVLRQGVELQREDVEHLIYTDEGWGPWEDEFRNAWDAAAEPAFASERAALAGGPPPSSWRPLRAGELLGAEVAAAAGGDRSRQAMLISDRPLLAVVPDFATSEECAELIELGFRTCRPHNKWAQEAQRPGAQRAEGAAGPVRGVATASLRLQDLPVEDQPLLDRMQRRVAALTGVPDHGREIRPFLKFDRPGEATAGRDLEEDDLSIGLHIDTNGGFEHCVCSVIIYLNSCEGGRTVFPCAGDAESRELGAELRHGGHTHTSNKRVHEAGHSACAGRLVDRAEVAEGALRVSPRRGTAVLFFSLLGEEGQAGARDAPPVMDAWSWHGGSAVKGDVGKWTLQIFKEVPPEQRGGRREAEYVASLRERVLQAAQKFQPFLLSEMD